MYFTFIIQHLGVSYLHSASVWRAVETQRQRLADEVAKVVDWYRLNPKAKLRIGFVSFNYNNHPVSVLYPKIHIWCMHISYYNAPISVCLYVLFRTLICTTARIPQSTLHPLISAWAIFSLERCVTNCGRRLSTNFAFLGLSRHFDSVWRPTLAKVFTDSSWLEHSKPLRESVAWRVQVNQNRWWTLQELGDTWNQVEDVFLREWLAMTCPVADHYAFLSGGSGGQFSTPQDAVIVALSRPKWSTYVHIRIMWIHLTNVYTSNFFFSIVTHTLRLHLIFCFAIYTLWQLLLLSSYHRGSLLPSLRVPSEHNRWSTVVHINIQISVHHVQNTLWSKCPCSTVTTSIIIYECMWWWGERDIIITCNNVSLYMYMSHKWRKKTIDLICWVAGR